MAEENKSVQLKKDVGSQVLERINQLCEAGFVLPKDYSAINAVKASMLVLQETVDKNKRPALEVCTSVSVQKALFSMVTQGLDVSRGQGWFIVRGDKLTFMPSYFGNMLQVRRLYPKWSPVAHTIREGDEFVYTINPENGKMKLVKHEQKLENLDKDFVGAYMYIPCADGEQELYVMTRKQILKAWSKSSSSTLQTHKDFDEKMAIRTVVNSGCKKVISSTPVTDVIHDNDEDPNNFTDPVGDEGKEFVDFEEVAEEHKEPEQIAAESENKPEQPQDNNDEF